MRELTVSLGERSYPVLIGAGLVDGCPALVDLAAGRQVAVVTNDVVAPLYGERFARWLRPASSEFIEIVLPDGERHKDWPSLQRVFDQLLARRFDRRCLVVALGGGVIGDLAGFAAAVYQRGVEFVQVPTTLLSQVDSSIGGKTAINHPAGKNMIGAFHQPRLVVADVATLATLPARELSAGLAEMIKHGAISDPAYLAQLERDCARLLSCDAAALTAAIERSCEIKAAVVAADERESGVRATLNFGHTFGHAIESGLGFGTWLHGEAVAAGMVMAADLSRRLGMLDSGAVERLRGAIAAARLPVAGPAWDSGRYLELMAVDKKAEQGIPKFVLLSALGHALVRSVPEPELRATLEQCVR